MRTMVLLAFLLPAFSKTREYLHALPGMEAVIPGDAPIRITINPEARVSVSRGGELPPSPACGTAMEVPVTIINQAFLTAPLEATLVGNTPTHVRLEFPPDPLKGLPQEMRVLRVTLNKPEPTDLTISFRARNDIPDLGGRDRIHFLLRCH
jgi:hypothetical protein